VVDYGEGNPQSNHGRRTIVLLIKVSLYVTITIHGFSKGPSSLTSLFLLMDMYILIKSLGLE
jgi:hypothetical protein